MKPIALRKWIIAASVGGLAGCVAEPVEPPPQAMIGANEVQLIRAMGVPTKTFMAAGHKFDAYIKGEQIADSFGGGPYWGGWGPGWGWGGPWGGWGGGWDSTTVRNYRCETTFELVGDTVASFTKHGNDC